MSDVTQKIETPVERVARLEAELRQAREEAGCSDARTICQRFPIGSKIMVPLTVTEHDTDHDEMPLRACYQGAPIWIMREDISNPADFIPRAEHERLVEEARQPLEITPTDAVAHLVARLRDCGSDWTEYTHESFVDKYIVRVERANATPAPPNTPQDSEQELVGYVCLNDEGEIGALKSDEAFAKEWCAGWQGSTYVPLYRRPAPLTEQAKPVKTGWDGLKDGDECWIRCEVKGAEKHTVRLPDGSDFKWYVSPKNIAAAPVPAPAPAAKKKAAKGK